MPYPGENLQRMAGNASINGHSSGENSSIDRKREGKGKKIKNLFFGAGSVGAVGHNPTDGKLGIPSVSRHANGSISSKKRLTLVKEHEGESGIMNMKSNSRLSDAIKKQNSSSTSKSMNHSLTELTKNAVNTAYQNVQNPERLIAEMSGGGSPTKTISRSNSKSHTPSRAHRAMSRQGGTSSIRRPSSRHLQ